MTSVAHDSVRIGLPLGEFITRAEEGPADTALLLAAGLLLVAAGGGGLAVGAATRRLVKEA